LVRFPLHCFELEQSLKAISLKVDAEGGRIGWISTVAAAVPASNHASVPGDRATVIEVFNSVILKGTRRDTKAWTGSILDSPGEQRIRSPRAAGDGE